MMHDIVVAFAGSILPSIGVLLVWLQNNARFNGIDGKFEGVNQRFEQVNQRFEQVNQRFEQVNQRFDDMRDLWRAELRRVEEVIDARLKHLEEK
jgi:methyl-accepting chemotaxis protein